MTIKYLRFSKKYAARIGNLVAINEECSSAMTAVIALFTAQKNQQSV